MSGFRKFYDTDASDRVGHSLNWFFSDQQGDFSSIEYLRTDQMSRKYMLVPVHIYVGENRMDMVCDTSIILYGDAAGDMLHFQTIFPGMWFVFHCIWKSGKNSGF